MLSADVPDEFHEPWENVEDPAEIPQDALDYPDDSVQPDEEGDDSVHKTEGPDFSEKVMPNPNPPKRP